MSAWMISCFQSFLRLDRDCSCSSYLQSLQNSNLITLKIEYYCHKNLRQLTKTSDKIIMKSTSIPECLLQIIFFLTFTYNRSYYCLVNFAIIYLPLALFSQHYVDQQLWWKQHFQGTRRLSLQMLLARLCEHTLLPHHAQTSSATKHKVNPTEYRHIVRNAVSAKDEHRPQPLALLKHSPYPRKLYI